MSTGEVSKGMFGEELYQERARKALPILVRQAKAGQKIYYTDLAKELGMPNPRNLNYPLGSIGTELKRLGEKWNEEIPQIQCIVVNKNTELPGDGFGWFIGECEYTKLNKRQKEARLNIVQAKAFSYRKWDTVLKALGLDPMPISAKVRGCAKRVAFFKGYGGGESESHKKLKEFVKNNPPQIGIKLKRLEAEVEKGLPSGDSVDVFFETPTHWIGVEVKSKISNEEDILRGLYQCVKY